MCVVYLVQYSFHSTKFCVQFSAKKLEKDNNRVNLKFPSQDQKANDKNGQRPVKRQRLGDVPTGGEGGASSDSDPEQNLTAYYTGAITLADTPEERKRRESRSKRFEKSRGNRVANNNFKPKNAGAGIYARKDTALEVRKNFDDSNSRPVEDIDWDSLTVKGTCQEIEKGYLRLTSAPDPATVSFFFISYSLSNLYNEDSSSRSGLVLFQTI